jgi:hypothetical protein
MTTCTDLRLALREHGFFPLPLIGKKPVLQNWSSKFDSNSDEIALWERLYGSATNTGILTKPTPALDADVTHPEAAEAIEALILDRFADIALVPTRVGQPPKRIFLFRAAQPITKITRVLISPDGGEERIELLGDGQQVVVVGIHPTTQLAYLWFGADIVKLTIDDLVEIDAGQAQQLVDDIVRLLIFEFGYREKTTKPDGPDHDPDHGRLNWAHYLANPIDHDVLTQFAAALICGGLTPGAAVNLLRAHVGSLEPSDRRQRRFLEIPSMVESAWRKFVEQAKPPPQLPDENDGTALGYSWHWHWHGEVDPLEQRKWLVETILPETGTALISGQWGTYKSFTAIDLAASVMTETLFINFPVMRKGGVLLLACEGQSEVDVRITAAYEAKGGTGKAPFAWQETCPRLLDPNASKILTAMIKHAANKMLREFGVPIALVVIDTAGKAAGLTRDGQLNDDTTAKLVMNALAEASRETGALFVGVAHFGKNKEAGTKGSTGFEDDADVILALLGERGINGVVENPRLCLRKRRTGPNGEEFPFRVRDAELGINESGKLEKTLTIEWPTATEVKTENLAKAKGKDPWGARSIRQLRQVLMNMLADVGSQQRPYPDGPLVRAVDLELVRAEFYKSYPAVGNDEAKADTRQKAFRRAVNEASARGLIKTRDIGAVTFVWLTTPDAG